ncbi:hypothetical protein XH88_22730 [Bradyrhizobium sp. CCBAU 51627]|nr:hypothetical protein [Bradyrhizobium sp. CCBAU 51627]
MPKFDSCPLGKSDKGGGVLIVEVSQIYDRDSRIRHLTPQAMSQARARGRITIPAIAPQWTTRKTVAPAHVGSAVKAQ